MKHLLLTIPLLFASCRTPEVIEPSGAVQRLVERVAVRHDAYVQADTGLDEAAREEALGQSAECIVLVYLPEVSVLTLSEALGPVSARHDAYVQADPALDALARETYLGSTASLGRLIDAARAATGN